MNMRTSTSYPSCPRVAYRAASCLRPCSRLLPTAGSRPSVCSFAAAPVDEHAPQVNAANPSVELPKVLIDPFRPHGGASTASVNGHAAATHAHLNGIHHEEVPLPAASLSNSIHAHSPHLNGANGTSSSHVNGSGHHNHAVLQPSLEVVAVNGQPIHAALAASFSLPEEHHSSTNGHHVNGNGYHASNGSSNGIPAGLHDHIHLQHAESSSAVQGEQHHTIQQPVQPVNADHTQHVVPLPVQPINSDEPQQPQEQPPQLDAQGPDIPKPILIISLVSACLTMASCVFNTLLPIYMVTELKMNMRSMGMFEGLLEAFSYVVRMFSGVVSDMMTSRKSAITLGFAMGAMAKFGMTAAGSVGQLFASKAIDRLANGVQAAPRDALISDLAPAASRSACFGFAQSMRKWGSFIGAGMSFFLMRASGNNYKLIFLLAASITVASTAAFVLLVPSHARPLSPAEKQQKEDQQKAAAAAASLTPGSPEAIAAAAAAKPQTRPHFNLSQFLKDGASMGSDFYRMLLVISMYGLGHINESMLEARAIEVGFGKAESTLVVAMLALVISVSAWPLGQLDDKHGPRTTFAVGMSALIAGNLVMLLSASQPWAVFASLCFLGVHWAVIQGPLLSIVVSLAPPNLRGTAFGIFYTVMATTTMIGNSVYGTVWHTMGAPAAFTVSAGWILVSLIALPHLLPESVRHGKLKTAPAPTAKPAVA